MASMDGDSVDEDEFGAFGCGPRGWRGDIMVVSECSEEDDRASCLMRTSERHVDYGRHIYGQ